MSPEYLVHFNSSVDNLISTGRLMGRPYGGLAILIKRKLCAEVTLIHKDDRFIIIKLGSLLLCNVYLPYNDYDLYNEILSQIAALLSCTMESFSHYMW